MSNPRMDVLRHRKDNMNFLKALVLSDIPAELPEIQKLRMKISAARALFLAMETALTSLHEREIPRSMRTVDPNAHLVHIESRALVEVALQLITHAKTTL